MKTKQLITRLTKVMYIFGIIFLLTGMLLSAVQLPVSANAGSIWTTDGSCGESTQDVNHFDAGDKVFINGAGFDANTEYNWSIQGQPNSGDPTGSVASGTLTSDENGAFCKEAYTVAADDYGEYKVNAGGKNDNYGVDSTGVNALSIVKTAAPATYDSVGDVIVYNYDVTNSGTVTLFGISVVDDKASVTCDDTSDGLAPNATITCAASYTITQSDLDSGFVTNVAYATDGTTDSTPDDETVTADQNSALTIVKTASPKTYDALDDVINYSYEVTNSGNLTLYGIMVNDDKTTVTCPDTSAGLAPGAKVTCSATYTITADDLTSGSVKNIAYATDGTTTSPDDDETITFDALPTLTIDKTATPKTYDAVDDVISYSYLVTNTGNVALYGITVNDDKATVTCPDTSAGLAPLTAITCTASYNITADDLTAGSVKNTAYATNGTISSNTDSETVYAELPALSLKKSVTETTYDAVNDVLHYSYTLTNSGNVILTGPFTVTDDKIAGTISCPAASLGLGESTTCTADYSVTQADLDAAKVTNTAKGHVTYNSTVVDSNTDSATVNGDPKPALHIDKTADETTFDEVGDVLHYNFLVTNIGNVTLYDQFIVMDFRIGKLTDCPSLTSLAPGESFMCHGTFTIRQYDMNWGAVENTAQARASTDPVDCCAYPVFSNIAELMIYGQKPGPSLSLEKTVDPATYDAVGDVLSYDYKLINNGNATLFGPFTVNDNKLSVDCSGAAASLEPLESTQCTASYNITQNDLEVGEIINTAQAFGWDFFDAKVTSNFDDAKATGTQNPELTLVKSVTPDTFSAIGEVLNYTYVLTNSGNVILSGPFTVTDDKTTVTCPDTPASLNPTESITCTASYTTVQVDMDELVVTNTAKGHGYYGTDVVDSNEDTATATGNITGPALNIVKSVTETAYSIVGDILHYSYELQNIGDVTLWGPFSVFDDKSIDETCELDAATDTLAPGATTTCTATYTIALADLISGSVTNVAYAQGFFRGDPVLSKEDDETVTASLITPTVSIESIDRSTCEEDAGEVCIDFTLSITNLTFGTVDFFADLPSLVAADETTVITEDGEYVITVCGNWPGISDRGKLVELAMSVYANWVTEATLPVDPNPIATATAKVAYDPDNRFSCFPQDQPVFANPFCNKVDGSWRMSVNLKNPNDTPVDITWTIDDGSVKSGTIQAFSSLRLGNLSLDKRHVIAVYWGEEGFLELRPRMNTSQCYNPPKPPELTTTTYTIPVTAVEAPAPVTEAVVLIPVTGADLGDVMQSSFIRKLMFYLGLSFLGMAFITHSLRNRFLK